jgi:malonyl-CoA O-methyltransferase
MIVPPHKNRIARAFGRASGYAAEAHVQRQVAHALAERIAATWRTAEPSILEIGCGTGFLTAALAAHIAPASWTITDIAPEMVARASASLKLPGAYRTMDGEHPDLGDARFDLIVSSLAFQWFADLPSAVARLAGLLKPGGVLAFATMAAGSFMEWRAAHKALRLTAGTPHYPDADALQALTPNGFAASVEVVPFVQQHEDARAFLRQLKAIGAATATNGHRTASPGELRRVMAAYDAGPRTATYHVGFCLFRAPPIG